MNWPAWNLEMAKAPITNKQTKKNSANSFDQTIYKTHFFLIQTSLVLVLISCEQNSSTTTRINRFVASEHLLKIDGKETISKGVKEFLFEEQNLYAIETSNGLANKTNGNSSYIPKNNPKFPLPYYLVPEEDANYLFTNLLDTRISDQLVMTISGKKHYKLFIHPESEVYYDFLHRSYNYVGHDQSEFYASPTSDFGTLVVWNRNNGERKPFIAKISLDQNILNSHPHIVSGNEIERSISTQKVLDRIGETNLNLLNFKFFPESAGLTVNKAIFGSPSKLGGQLISEIPDEVVRNEKKWFSFSALINPNRKPAPLIMDIIQHTGLSSFDFFKTYMIDGYLNMFEGISLKNGINFEPHLQNLAFETTSGLKPTGKWALKEYSEIRPDIFTIAKNGGPVDIYIESSSALKYKFKEARGSYISSFVIFYKPLVFDSLIATVSKHDLSLTADQIQTLKNTLDIKYIKMINSHFGLNLKTIPNITNYKNIEEIIIAQTALDEKTVKKEIKDTENLKTFINNKKNNQEWIELSSQKGKSEFYLTNHGLYQVINKKVVGLALFNPDELEEYNANNKMLTNFKMLSVEPPEKTGCFGMVANFFNKEKK